MITCCNQQTNNNANSRNGDVTSHDNDFLSGATNQPITPGDLGGIFDDGSSKLETIWKYKVTGGTTGLWKRLCRGELEIGISLPFKPMIKSDTVRCAGVKIDLSKIVSRLSVLSPDQTNSTDTKSSTEDIVKIENGVIYLNNFAGMRTTDAGIPVAPSIFTKTNNELRSISVDKTLAVDIAEQGLQTGRVRMTVEDVGITVNGQEDSVQWRIEPSGLQGKALKAAEKITLAISKKNLNIPHISIVGDVTAVIAVEERRRLLTSVLKLIADIKISIDLVGKVEE